MGHMGKACDASAWLATQGRPTQHAVGCVSSDCHPSWAYGCRWSVSDQPPLIPKQISAAYCSQTAVANQYGCSVRSLRRLSIGEPASRIEAVKLASSEQGPDGSGTAPGATAARSVGCTVLLSVQLRKQLVDALLYLSRRRAPVGRSAQRAAQQAHTDRASNNQTKVEMAQCRDDFLFDRTLGQAVRVLLRRQIEQIVCARGALGGCPILDMRYAGGEDWSRTRLHGFVGRCRTALLPRRHHERGALEDWR